MPKKILTIVALLVLVLIATGFALYIQNVKSAEKQNSAEMERRRSLPDTTEKTSSVDEQKSTASTVPGTYVDYTDSIIDETPGTKVLFFHAPWCPQCRSIDADIKAQELLPDNTTIIKVDYDSHQDLRQKYGVTLQTTFVMVDDDGQLVKKYVAYSKPTYASVEENLLK